MNIKVNDEEVALEGTTVGDLARQLNLPSGGVAVAVGMELVPREEWDNQVLEEGTNVLIIRAAQGG